MNLCKKKAPTTIVRCDYMQIIISNKKKIGIFPLVMTICWIIMKNHRFIDKKVGLLQLPMMIVSIQLKKFNLDFSPHTTPNPHSRCYNFSNHYLDSRWKIYQERGGEAKIVKINIFNLCFFAQHHYQILFSIKIDFLCCLCKFIQFPSLIFIRCFLFSVFFFCEKSLL